MSMTKTTKHIKALDLHLQETVVTHIVEHVSEEDVKDLVGTFASLAAAGIHWRDDVLAAWIMANPSQALDVVNNRLDWLEVELKELKNDTT